MIEGNLPIYMTPLVNLEELFSSKISIIGQKKDKSEKDKKIDISYVNPKNPLYYTEKLLFHAESYLSSWDKTCKKLSKYP